MESRLTIYSVFPGEAAQEAGKSLQAEEVML
jgi:hypothetical protein